MKNNLSELGIITWCVSDTFILCLGARCSIIGVVIGIDTSMALSCRFVSIYSIVSGLGTIAGDGSTTTGTSAISFSTASNLAGGVVGTISLLLIYSRSCLDTMDVLSNHMLL